MAFKVAFLGFSDFERSALMSYFRLALNRSPAYAQVGTLTDAEFLVADADHAPSVQLVVATERQGETVFVGAQAPEGAAAWTMRPIDALQVMRELDALVHKRHGGQPLSLRDLDRHDTVVLPKRTKVEQAGELLGGEAAAAAAAPRRTAATPPTVYPPPPQPVELTLPAEARPVIHRPPIPPRTAAPAPAPRLHALVVDDSEVARRFLSSKLVRFRLHVDEAATSEAALQLLAQRAYEFIFLDLDLGEHSELDGLALCQQIKQAPEWMNSTVIFVSAHHSELDRARGALAGCDAYLAKPLDEVELQRLMLRHGLKAPKDAGATTPP